VHIIFAFCIFNRCCFTAQERRYNYLQNYVKYAIIYLVKYMIKERRYVSLFVVGLFN